MPSPIYVAEPEAAYYKRAALVVDSSLLAAWVFGEPRAAEALARIQGHQLYAPTLLLYEMANIGMNKIRSAQIEVAQATGLLASFRDADIRYESVDGEAILHIAAALKLTAYDAAYVYLAEQLQAPLATFDEMLGKAAQGYFAKGVI